MQCMDATKTQTDETPAAETRCGAEHKGTGVTCDQARNHDRWAHQHTTSELDGQGYVQTTTAWVDWEERGVDVLDKLERLRQRRIARMRA